MILADQASEINGVSKSTIYALHSRKNKLNDYRFQKINGRLYVLVSDYKHPFADEINSKIYEALEVTYTWHRLYREIEKRTGLGFKKVKGIITRGSFKNPHNAMKISKALDSISKERLF